MEKCDGHPFITVHIFRPSIAVEQLEAIRSMIRENAGLMALFGGEGTLKREVDKLEAFDKLQVKEKLKALQQQHYLLFCFARICQKMSIIH